MIPNNITKEHLEKAIKEIDQNGITKGRQSSTYNLVHDGKHYPPKLIISIANKYANGVELDSSEFEGGIDTQAFKLLESFKYKIIEKKNLKDIIKECQFSFSEIKHDYKTDYEDIFKREKDWLNNVEEKTYRLSENIRVDIDYVISKLKDESYQFKNTDTEKISLFISQINSVIHIANRINNFKQGTELDNNKSLKLFELFNKIKATDRFDDFNFPLNKNLKSFSAHLYSVVKHCQSPDNYPIYYKYWKNILGEVLKKNDDYDSLCSFYQTMPTPKHLSLATYFGTLGTILARKISENQIIKEEDDKNYKYIRNKILNIHYFDIITGYKRKPNYYIIGSKYGENNDKDVFPRMLENKVVSIGFASHIDLSDFYLTDESEIVESLKGENEVRNSYNALKLFLNIKPGDKVAIKASGSPKGKKGFLSIVGIFEVVKDENGNVYNYDPKGLGHTINVKVIKAPIYKEFELGGYGSTVHKLSKKNHISQIFNQINNIDNQFLQIKSKFDTSVFENYIRFLRKIASELSLLPNDGRIVYSVSENRLNFTVGQRYCYNLYLNDSRGVYGVISKDQLLDNSEAYDGNLPQPFYTYFNKFNPNLVDWKSIIEAIKGELDRTSQSGFRRHNNSDFENYVFEIVNKPNTNDDTMKLSLNTILYGPPGTGKTYNTINYALDVLGLDVSNMNRNEILNLYRSKIDSGEIIFTTFHQSISYEDFIEGIKPETKDGRVTYKLEDGLFKELCSSKSFFKINDSFGSRNQYEIISVSKAVLRISRDSGVVDLSMEFINEMLHLFFSKQITLDDIKTENRDNIREKFQTKWDKYLFGYDSMYKGLLEYVNSKNKHPQDTRKVIIIDEINRGNVSSIFGELITLIEEDKRIGNTNYTPVKLPYSKDFFGVPNNLYIIGTMNTADRSVEALDTALRRRFSFIEMNPEPAKLNSPEFKCIGIDLASLLTAINARIEKLLDRDYCIGHSYFMTIKNRQEPLNEIKAIFQNKILPLLQEYFYGDWGKILLVIGKEFVETKTEEIKFLSTESYENVEEYDERPIYTFTKPSFWTLDSFRSIYE